MLMRPEAELCRDIIFNFAHQYPYYYCQALSLGWWRPMSIRFPFLQQQRHSPAQLCHGRCSTGTTGVVVFLWEEFTYMIWIHKVIKVSRDTGNYFADLISSDNLSKNAPHSTRSSIPASTAKIQTSTELSTILHSPWPWENHFWAAASGLVALSKIFLNLSEVCVG